MILQCALAVVREHQHLDPGEQCLDIARQSGGVGIERLLEIHAQQLLVTAHDAQLDDGRLVVEALEVGFHAGATEAVAQTFGGFVFTGYTNQQGARTERRDIQRHVGSAAWAVLDLVDTHHGHRGFRGNPRGAAMPVAIEHHIAHHQYGGLVIAGHGQFHGGSRRGEKRKKS